MKLNYFLDISEKSTWFVNTPNAISKQLPFYINEYGHYIAGPAYFTERQGQKNYLLIYTLSGNGYLNYLGQEYTLESNQAVIIYCDHYHLYRTCPDGLWNFKWIHFNGIAAKGYITLLNQDALNVITVDEPLRFEKMLDNLFLSFDVNDITTNVKISMHMMNIVSHLIINRFTPANNKKYTEHRQEIEKVLNYIHLNYSKRIDLDELTRIAYMSKYYLLRLFKKHVGVSPYEYLLNYRITKAKELLKNTEYSISEVCNAVGFNDYNNFIREFKKVVGTTPFSYKKYSRI